MKTLQGVVAVLLAYAPVSNAVESSAYAHNILRVIDGDTIVVSAPYLPHPLKPELSVRLFGVDTPEKDFRAKCSTEDVKAKEATEFTKAAISKAKKIEVVLYSWDKYGGRVLGNVVLDRVSLRDMLVSKGLAREYYGDAKQSWCKN